MKKIIVLGAGMVGSAIAADLATDFSVTSVDQNMERLLQISRKYGVKIIAADLSDKKEILSIIKDADLVIGAVPGFMGYETVKTVIEAGKNIVDISFFPEDPFLLDELAKNINVTAMVDCGVAPGLSNIILGYHNSTMNVEEFTCMVGGLPFRRELPFEYKAPFSPIDVIEEYTRPARLMENNREVVKPALSEPETIELPHAGELVAFNTDGLRSLLRTMKIPNMKEKTLRYPKHFEYMSVLNESGFFSNNEIDINGMKIKPVNVTAKLLLPMWKLEPNEPEFTVMQIIIKGVEDGKNKKYTYDLFDTYDKVSGLSSMARTTGYTCTAAARLVLNGDFDRIGISPPEYIGESEKNFSFVLSELRKRNTHLNVIRTEIV